MIVSMENSLNLSVHFQATPFLVEQICTILTFCIGKSYMTININKFVEYKICNYNL